MGLRVTAFRGSTAWDIAFQGSAGPGSAQILCGVVGSPRSWLFCEKNKLQNKTSCRVISLESPWGIWQTTQGFIQPFLALEASGFKSKERKQLTVMG